jgi:hypothetical protein
LTGTDDFWAAAASEARATGRNARRTRDLGRDQGGLIMRKLIATVFNYSLDGLLADEGTEFW